MHMISVSRNAEKYIFVILLAFAVLTPSMAMPAGLPAVRADFVIVFTAWGFLLFRQFLAGIPIILPNFLVYKLFGLFSLSILFSMLYGAFVKKQPLVLSDFLNY